MNDGCLVVFVTVRPRALRWAVAKFSAVHMVGSVTLGMCFFWSGGGFAQGRFDGAMRGFHEQQPEKAQPTSAVANVLPLSLLYFSVRLWK